MSKTLVKDIYGMTAEFPVNEKYALSDQMRRAVVSIPSNIAEGTSKTSPKEQYHFLEISYGSLMELMCQTEIAFDLCYISKDQFCQIEEEIGNIYKMLLSMHASLKSRLQSNHL
ncbi:MAG: four helix bundle protein [Prevotella sp.]|nr:four helix bundle protein [Prevotella sp.]